VMATIEHLSNAGLCAQNRGLTNIGARIGYTF
jgi:lipid A 3-O-deacylase